MGWKNNIVALVPIALSSVIACVSALIKFRNFPSQMEIILQSQSLLTHTLTNARNKDSITPVLLKEYNDALEKLETALYPDIRKQYMVQSHRNLISIMKQEAKYFELIELINSGHEVGTSRESGNTTPFESENSSPNPFDSSTTTPNPFEPRKTIPNPFGNIFEVDI
jgi:hypothetical protein